MSRTLRMAVAGLGIGLAVGCAARRPPLDPTLPARAAALVREGCYDCLSEARDIYARLEADGRVASATVRLFEVDLLLALRHKELALDPAEPLERARALAPRLPATVDATRFVELVEIIP